MRITKYITGLAALLSLAACDVQKKSATEAVSSGTVSRNDKDCPPDLMCTMDYRMITVKVHPKNRTNGPVLDEVRIFLTDNPRTEFSAKAAGDMQSGLENGVFIIAEDGNMSQVAKTGSKVTFVGYKDGEEKIQEQYVIGHDCCHIQLISGPKELTY